METIGLIGGMSWQSTRTYYDLLNEKAATCIGDLHSAEMLMRSVDSTRFEAAMYRGDGTAIKSCLGEEAAALERGSVGCVLLSSNTKHKLYGNITTRVGIPFFHIPAALGHSLAADRLKRVGLLGTRFNMVKYFYATRLLEGFGIDVILPEERQIGRIDVAIFDELRRGVVEGSWRDAYLEIMARASHAAC